MDESEETEGRGEVSQATRAPRSAAQADARSNPKPTTVAALPLHVRQELWKRIWKVLLAPRPKDVENGDTRA